VIVENGQRNLYLKTAFGYHQTGSGKSVYSDVKLCLHDSPEKPQYYFFESNEIFSKDWAKFVDYIDRNNLSKKTFDFGIASISRVESNSYADNKNYIFQYDLELFDSYDGNPIKYHDLTLFKHCDVLVGEFFMSKYSENSFNLKV
jgi:hypothetical protein